MEIQGEKQIEHSELGQYNKALLENMAFFADSCGVISLESGKCYIFHDKDNPERVGCYFDHIELLDIFFQENRPNTETEVREFLDLDRLKRLTKSEEINVRVNDDKIVRRLRLVITPETVDGKTKYVYVSHIDVQKELDEMDRNEEQENSAVVSFNQKVRDILEGANIGMWDIILDEGEPKFILDKTMAELVGVGEDVTPEEAFKIWQTRVDAKSMLALRKYIANLRNGIRDEVIYPYNHPTKGMIYVRCGGIKDDEYQGPGIALTGYHQDVTAYNRFQTEAQEFLNLLNEIVGSGMWYAEFNEEGEFSNVVFSDTFRHLLGYENKEVFPDDLDFLLQIVHPDNRDALLFSLGSIAKDDTEFDIKIRARKKTGAYELYNSKAKCIRYENGKPRLLFGTLVNITMTENASMDMNVRLNMLLGGVRGGVRICNDDNFYSYVFVGKEVAAIQGYSVEEFFTASHGVAAGNVYIDDVPHVSREIKQLLDEGDSYTVKYRVRHKDGYLKWVYDFGHRVIMPTGETRIYSLIQDITEEELANERLGLERSMFRDALVHNAMFYCSVDVTDGLINTDFFNDKGESVLESLGLEVPADYDEFNRRLLKKLEITTIANEKMPDFSIKGLAKMFAKGRMYDSFEFYMKKIDRYCRITPLLSSDRNNGHIMATLIGYDVTDIMKSQIESQRQLMEALERAEAANSAKTKFLNSMSHDIRTPLNAIIGYTSLASLDIDDPEIIEDYLDKIQLSGEHLLDLVNDVLDMSRIESGKIVIEDKEESLPDIVSDLQKLFYEELKKKKLTYTSDVSGIKNTKVWCDRVRLNRILLNCIGNAVKYTPEGGSISLRLEEVESEKAGFGRYIFHIIDTGIGMTPEFAAKMFTAFERERNTTVSGIQGTGLGMTIAKTLVDLMGGDIEVHSQQGEGTELVISIDFKIVL